ncbi:hypothetical protein TEQG_08775 [Trichophyton equinum CBS 127.97]|uniref:Uncharacterized protein n=1 Tax=Trichophyton equinum (strain ATCC MYA-4606 / CBS 127.97) TaxID=559882 RepID=F2Q1B6_TRIEC|nr:hypothetical protein TEQG_08775 [Trichophyton equinum CBS 127.97]
MGLGDPGRTGGVGKGLGQKRGMVGRLSYHITQQAASLRQNRSSEAASCRAKTRMRRRDGDEKARDSQAICTEFHGPGMAAAA